MIFSNRVPDVQFACSGVYGATDNRYIDIRSRSSTTNKSPPGSRSSAAPPTPSSSVLISPTSHRGHPVADPGPQRSVAVSGGPSTDAEQEQRDRGDGRQVAAGSSTSSVERNAADTAQLGEQEGAERWDRVDVASATQQSDTRESADRGMTLL